MAAVRELTLEMSHSREGYHLQDGRDSGREWPGKNAVYLWEKIPPEAVAKIQDPLLNCIRWSEWSI